MAMKKILHFGVVGVGYFGRHYVRLLKELEGVMLSAVSRVSKKYEAEVFRFLTEGVRRYEKPEELFQDSKVECVIIAAPTRFHFELAKRALEAGKHVLLEKPMTRTLEEAELLRTTVEKSCHIFMVGHQYLYNDYIRRLKQEIERGAMGPPCYVFAEQLYSGPIRSDIGCFWESATHELAIIDYLFTPGSIAAAEGIGIDLACSGRDDFAVVNLLFESGLRATIVTSRLFLEKVRRLSIMGDRGMALFDDRKETEKLSFSFRQYPETGSPRERIMKPRIKAREPLENELAHFIDCVRRNATPLTDIKHGMRITGMLQAAREAIRISSPEPVRK